MHDDSDTESETELEPGTLFPCDANAVASQLLPSPVARATRQTVAQAIQDLSNITPLSIQKNLPTYETKIKDAANVISSLLTALLADTDSVAATIDGIYAFSDILSPSSMSMFFSQREAFHAIAMMSQVATTRAAPICWVDVVLAKLSVSIVNLVSTTNEGNPEAFPGLTKRREDDMLRAASQLPHDWKNIPSLISSPRISPAASRIALYLTFGSFVLHPHICQRQGAEPSGKKQLPARLPDILRRWVTTHVDVSRQDIAVLDKLACAMVVILFAYASDESPAETFQPATQDLLLHLIAVIASPSETLSLPFTPIMALDGPQTLLLRIHGVLPWIWRTWSDPRTLGAMGLIRLTSTWLYHSDDEAIISAISGDPDGAARALIQLLHLTITTHYSIRSFESSCDSGPSLSGPISMVLHRACAASARLLSPLNDWSIKVELAVELAMCLCIYALVLTDFSALESINEALSSLRATTMQAAMKLLKEDSRFFSRIDQVTTEITQNIQDSDSSVVPEVKMRLDFIAILWHSNVKGCFHRRSISAFLSAVVEYIKQEEMASSIPLYSLLNVLATLEWFRDDPLSVTCSEASKLWEDEDIWLLVMQLPNTDLATTCAFAAHITASVTHSTPGGIIIAEAWDYLRDTLLLIIHQHFIGDEEPLALLVCPSICQALSSLLGSADARTAQHILFSPWTMNLVASLKQVLGPEDTADDRFKQYLKKRLGRFSDRLIEQIDRLLNGTTIPTEREEPQGLGYRRMLFIRRDGQSSALIITE